MILLCAATRIEAQACLRGLQNLEGEIGFEVLQTGMGLDQAAQSLENRLKCSQFPRPSRVISTGFAGSTASEIKVGTWVHGTSIKLAGGVSMSLSANLVPLLKEAAINFVSLPLLSVREVVNANSLGQTEQALDGAPGAVDMESFSLAEVAIQHSIPFDILRMVSDTPEHPLPDSTQFFVQAVLAANTTRKLLLHFQGARAVLMQPRVSIEFLSRFSSLPALLAKGWNRIATSRTILE